MSHPPDNLGRIDPVLALLDHLKRYRRSWRCWLIGGPAAVDDVNVAAIAQTVGVQVHAYLLHETQVRVWRPASPSRLRAMRWHDSPTPTVPAADEPVDAAQVYPLAGTLTDGLCELCLGTGKKRCSACWASGTRARWGSRFSWDACPVCNGTGYVPCTHSGMGPAYQAAIYAYQHEWHTERLLTADAQCPAATRLFIGAWQTPGRRRSASPGSKEELRQRARAIAGVTDDGTLAWVRTSSRKTDTPTWEGLPVEGSKQRRVVRQELRAEVAHGARSDICVAGVSRRFWAVGLGDEFVAEICGPSSPTDRPGAAIGLALVYLLQGATWLYLSLALHTSGSATRPAGVYFGLMCFVLAVAFPMACRAIRRPLFSAARAAVAAVSGRGTRETPQVVVTGPDAGASALFYSLFAHLAGLAQLGDAGEGGTILDDTYLELPAWLRQGSPPPATSSTCRMALGSAVPGPERVRLVHMLCPGAPDALCRRTLARASKVWVVVPSGMGADEALTYARQIGAGVVLVPEDGRAREAAMAAAREWGDKERLWDVPLRELRDRTLAGAVSAEEAAGLVRDALGAGPANVGLPAAADALVHAGRAAVRAPDRRRA